MHLGERPGRPTGGGTGGAGGTGGKSGELEMARGLLANAQNNHVCDFKDYVRTSFNSFTELCADR